MRLIRDTWIVFGDCVRTTVTNPVWVSLGLFQPVLWLLLFGPLLRRLVGPGLPPGHALAVFVPGVLMMLALFSSLYIGFGLVAEYRAGVLERLAVTPAHPLAFLLGRVLRDIVALEVQAVLLLVVAYVMGLRAPLGGVAAALGVLALAGLLGASVSYGFALTLRDENMLAGMLNFLALPLMLLAGLMLPISLAPGWIQGVARADPFYYGVQAIRALILGAFGVSAVPVGFGVLGGLAIIAVVWVAPLFRRVTG